MVLLRWPALTFPLMSRTFKEEGVKLERRRSLAKIFRCYLMIEAVKKWLDWSNPARPRYVFLIHLSLGSHGEFCKESSVFSLPGSWVLIFYCVRLGFRLGLDLSVSSDSCLALETLTSSRLPLHTFTINKNGEIPVALHGPRGFGFSSTSCTNIVVSKWIKIIRIALQINR